MTSQLFLFLSLSLVLCFAQDMSVGEMESLPAAAEVNGDYLVITTTSPDTQPPTLLNFTYYGPEKPASWAEVSFSVSITDGTGTGVAAFHVVIMSSPNNRVASCDSPNNRVASVSQSIPSCAGCGLEQALFYLRCDCTEGSLLPVGAPWPNGVERFSGPLNGLLAVNGTYQVKLLVVDRVGNIAVYNHCDLSNLGFDNSQLTVSSPYVADNTPPQLTNINYISPTPTFAWNPMNPTYTPAITVLMNGSDTAQDLASMAFAFRPSQFNPVMTSMFPQLTGVSANFPIGTTNGGGLVMAQAVNQFPSIPTGGGGHYDVVARVSDYQGNTAYYSALDLMAMGFSSRVLVTGGSPDITAPTCDRLSTLVATSSANNPSIISFDGAMNCQDDVGGEGLGGYTVILQGPGPNPMQYTVNGKPGIPAQLNLVPVSSLGGVYSIIGLLVWDLVGNLRGYGRCADWVVDSYHQNPGLEKFLPTICDLSFEESDESVVKAGWITAVAIMCVMFVSVLVLSINQCRRDGCCDCCCSCCSCCYKSQTKQLPQLQFSLGA